MGMHFGTEPKIADIAASLLAAWESGDRVRLERAVQEASSDLSAGAHGSLHMSELRELLLGVVQGLHGLLSTAQPADFRRGRQWEVCHDLLRHARGNAVAADRSGPQIHSGMTA